MIQFSKSEGQEQLSTVQELPAPLDEVFQFFADPANLERLTPPQLQFEIITPEPIAMGEGTLIDYRLRIHRVPVRWQSEITAYEPGRRFVDEQRRGPYRVWHHEHVFEATDGGTRVIDRVNFAAPLGWLTVPLLVRPDLKRIFGYRRQTLNELFPG